MKTFDWSLFELYNEGTISYNEAIHNADSANELRLNIKLNGTRQPKEPGSVSSAAETDAESQGFDIEATSRELALEPDLLDAEAAPSA
jgi:twitching motility protein PilU